MIFVINITTATSFYILSPTLPKYALTLQLSSAMAGFTTMVFVLASTLVRPFTGPWADKANLRALLAVSLGVIALAIFGFAAVESAAMLMVFRVVQGVGWGLATTVTGTYASRSLPEERIGQGIGIFGLASVLASAAAPSIGLAISARYGYSVMFLFAAVLNCTGLLLCIALPSMRAPESEGAEAQKTPLIERVIAPKAAMPAILVLLAVCATSSIGTFIAVYADKLGIAGIGLFFTVSAAAVFLARPFSGHLSDTVDRAFIVIPGLALTAIALLLIFLARNLWLLLVAAVIYGLGYGSLQPALQAWGVRMSGASQRGRANSTFYMGLDLGTGIGALLSGFLADRIGYQAMYLCMIAPLLIAAALFLVSERWVRRTSAGAPATAMGNYQDEDQTL